MNQSFIHSFTLNRLPSISSLNGSVVSAGEREDAERFFIRYHLDYPEEELPYRYTWGSPAFMSSASVGDEECRTDQTIYICFIMSPAHSCVTPSNKAIQQLGLPPMPCHAHITP